MINPHAEATASGCLPGPGATRIPIVFATASATASPASTTGAGTRRSRCRNDVTPRPPGRARLACRRWWLVCRWLQGVVPLAVEPIPRQGHRRQLLIAHLDPRRVAALVQLRPDPQARLCGGRP